MKNFKILKIAFLINALFEKIISDICQYKPDECESCYLDFADALSLICTIENKTDFELLQKVNSITHQFYPNFSIYSLISIQNKNFKLLPKFLFEHIDIVSLDLSYNEIELISNETFSMIKSVNFINLKNNKLKTLDSFFASLTSNKNMMQQVSATQIVASYNQIEVLPALLSSSNFLYSMDLSFNQILKCNYGAFNNLTELKTVSLDQNKISYIDDFFFASLNNLNELMLSENQLVYIKKYSFSGLSSLNTLYLINNLIKLIEVDSFRDLKNLKYLFLENNNIRDINNFTFYGMNQLETLSLEHNYFERLNKNAFFGLESLKYLSLETNILGLIEPDAFFNLKSITKLFLNNNLLDLSFDFFEHLANIEILNIENNRVKKLNTVDFGYLKKLTYLSLSSNLLHSIDSAFNKFDFSDMVITLDLSSNRLTKITNNDFGSKFQNLEYLYLNDNKISEIQNEAFKYMKKLKRLRLNENFLLEIENFTLISLGFLNYLDLSKNSISNIHRETFKGLTIMNSFNLEENYLNHLNDHLFYDLNHIFTLHINKNQIEFISDKLFNCSNMNIIGIQNFYLSSNKIKKLNFLRSCLQKLEKIDLSNNLIEHIEKRDFEFLKSLSSIDLSNNRIIFIEKNAFKSLNLNELILKNMSSSLAYFRFSLFQEFPPDLTILDLSYNNIQSSLDTNDSYVIFDRLFDLKMVKCFIDGAVEFPFEMFPNLNHLDFSFNNINVSKNGELFSSLIYMKYLRLNNVKLKSISLINSNITENVRELDLSFNLINNIDSKHLKEYLFYLDLSHNSIEIIEQDALSGTSIKYLDLSYNKIKYLRVNEFYSAIFLHSLFINNNLISNFSQLTINYLENVDEMRLSFNSLEIFNSEIYFAKKSTLIYLYLDHNLINEINTDSFKLLTQLTTLFLNSNRIASIDANALDGFYRLEILRIDQNKIQRLDEYVFKNLFRLKCLNISSNSLKYIEINLFSSLFNLIDLDISNNNLRVIEPYSMLRLEKLKNLNLNQNKNLSIDENSLVGLLSIGNIYISFEVLLNETNKRNIINSINLTLSTIIMNRKYFKSVNFIAEDFNVIGDARIKNECNVVLYFLKFNFFLNLKTDHDVSEFLKLCDKIT